ncbi:MAG TPA: peptidylprolyl isomerase [Acidobacteriaceae bacterium]|jgi:peptidyl-prolyl cis-trans isomerase SurA|nr:peptidylprolyl isomerase [Acidobacteriaceae bacterium]
MMLRVVLRTAVPLAVAAVFCLPAAAQSNSAASSSTPANVYGTPVAEIVVRVNDQVITNTDLLRAQQQLNQEARQQNWSDQQLADQQHNLLRDLIDKQLLLSKGKQLGITGDTELIKSLDEIRKQNHLDSMEALERAVQQQGTSYEDFKANIRDNIITQTVVRNEVGSKLQASQGMMQKYYDAHKDGFAQQESIHLSEILIPTDANASDAQLAAADARAKDIETKLKSGGDFAQFAKQYSSGPTAQQGGELGEFHRGALAKVLEDQTFSLPSGGVTQPIRTKQGYVILKVTQHIPGGVPTLQQVEPQVEEAVYMEQMQPALRSYLTRLREEAYIDIRPGYIDSGASPNETKPIYSAYTPPQSKKKKKQEKERLEKEVRYTRYRGKNVPVELAPATSSATTSTAKTASSSSVGLVPATATTKKKKKIKREKIRYGRAPLNRVSDEQVAAAPGANAAPAVAEAPADANLGSDAQPLGPDLTHSPSQEAPQGKTRLSDEAKRKREIARNKPKHSSKKKTHLANQSNASTPQELATQKAQDAPLGLDGDTSQKHKKAKKTTGKPGEKTRLSDEDKKKKSSDTEPAQAPASSSSPAPQQ